MSAEPESRVEHEFAFEFDEAFLRTVLKRDIAWQGVYASLLMGVAALGGWYLRGSFDGWLVATTAAALLFVAALTWFRLRFTASRTYQLLHKQAPDRVIRFRFDREGFELATANATNRYDWAQLRRLWRYSDVWLLEIVKNLSVFFPPKAAPDPVREYVVERCREAGVRI